MHQDMLITSVFILTFVFFPTMSDIIVAILEIQTLYIKVLI